MPELEGVPEEGPTKKEIGFDPHEIAKTLNSHAEPWNLVKDKSLPIPEKSREGLWCIFLRGISSETLLYLHPKLKLVVINLRSREEEHMPLCLYIANEMTKIHAVEANEARPEKSIVLETKSGTVVVVFESGRFRAEDRSGRKR